MSSRKEGKDDLVPEKDVKVEDSKLQEAPKAIPADTKKDDKSPQKSEINKEQDTVVTEDKKDEGTKKEGSRKSEDKKGDYDDDFDDEYSEDQKDEKNKSSERSPGKNTKKDEDLDSRYEKSTDKRNPVADRKKNEDSEDLDLDEEEDDDKEDGKERDVKLGKTMAETANPPPQQQQVNNDIQAEANNIMEKHQKESQAVDFKQLNCIRTTIFMLIALIFFVTFILLEVMCFVQEVCFHVDNVKINTVLGLIFFIGSVLSLVFQFLTYEVCFYGWKRVVTFWIIATLVVAVFHILVGIIFIIVTLANSSSFYSDMWDELSTSDKNYFDNNESDMEDAHVLNSMLASIFVIIEGVLYIIQFICMIIYRGYVTSNIPVTGKLPPAQMHGYDDMEEQPFINIHRKAKRKTNKKNKKTKKAKAKPQNL